MPHPFEREQEASICSLTFPWSARTPILTSTGLEHLIFAECMDIEARHRIAKTPADLCRSPSAH